MINDKYMSVCQVCYLFIIIYNLSFKYRITDKTNKKWKKDCTVQPMNTMRVA